jgi:anthranilate synthase component 2
LTEEPSPKLKVLLFDCRDSFTYNLAQAIDEILGPTGLLDVVRHDKLDLDEAARYDRLILSPGPGLPEEMANLLPLVRRYAGVKPILGVCLGHQAINMAFGGRLVNLKRVCHGVKSAVKIEREDYLFQGLPAEIETGRYHSWLVDEAFLPEELVVTARDENGQIMGLRHRLHNLRGLQFHPESILTPFGSAILRNFLLRREENHDAGQVGG